MKLKALIILLFCVAGIVMIGCTYNRPHVEEEYPDFTLTSTSGKSVTLSSFRNRSIVVLGIGDPYT